MSRKVRGCRIGSSHGVSRRVTGLSFYHGLSDFFLHTECRGGHELSNYRIFFTRSVAEGHELSNFLHTENRGGHGTFLFITNYRIFELILSITRRVAEVTDFLLSRDLSFGPTDQREVITELFLHT